MLVSWEALAIRLFLTLAVGVGPQCVGQCHRRLHGAVLNAIRNEIHILVNRLLTRFASLAEVIAYSRLPIICIASANARALKWFLSAIGFEVSASSSMQREHELKSVGSRQ